jgi:RNA polymerase sigma factor (sigma-70 family)
MAVMQIHRRLSFRDVNPEWNDLEAEWLRQVANGTPDAARLALNRLFVVFDSLFVKRMNRLLRNRELAEEAAQEIWIKVNRAAGNFRGERPAHIFLLGFLKNARRDLMKKMQRRLPELSGSGETVQAEIENALVALGRTPEQEAEFRDFLLCVRQAQARFAKAHPKLALLLRLLHMKGYSLEEVAAREGGNSNSVKQAVFAAREKFIPVVRPCLGLWPQYGGAER